MNVGFIGLGRMGRGIASNVLTASDDLVVYNRTREKASELAEAGARVASSVREACEGRDVVITMLADDAALNEIAAGPDGIRDSLAAGSIHMPMGTHGVGAIAALAAVHAEAGQTLVAAPVLGRPDVAAAGQLGIVAGGPEEAVSRCLPLLDAAGRHTFKAGPRPESASAIKLANNFMLGCAIEAIGEGMSLVRKYGVKPEVFAEVISDGLFASPAYKVYGKIIVDESYDNVGFTAELGLKDVNLVLEAANLARLPLPSANTYRDRLLGAMSRGEEQSDWAIMAREQARAGGLD
jgi:3-hydroxyisobutyrate dehydrogenase-like beta-hydroxyacid dehydrogenase